MAADLLMLRVDDALYPADQTASEYIKKMKQGEYVIATVKRARNPKHHRKAMAIFHTLFLVQDRYATMGQLIDAIKIGTGHCDEYQIRRGRETLTVVAPKSISFASMPQDAFSEWYDKAIRYIVTDILPGVSSEELQQEILNALGDS